MNNLIVTIGDRPVDCNVFYAAEDHDLSDFKISVSLGVVRSHTGETVKVARVKINGIPADLEIYGSFAERFDECTFPDDAMEVAFELLLKVLTSELLMKIMAKTYMEGESHGKEAIRASFRELLGVD